MILESPALLVCLLSAALRAVVAGAAVSIGLRTLRIGNVLAQKAAWILVLAASLTIPFVPRNMMPAWADLSLPSKLLTPAVKVSSPSLASPIPASHLQPPPKSAFHAFTISSTADGHSSSISNRTDAPSSASSTPANTQIIASDDPLAGENASRIAAPQPATPPDKLAHAKPAPFFIASLALLYLYLGVSALLICRLLAGICVAIRLWNTAETVTSRVISEISTRVRASDRVSSPVNIGSGILLPADYAVWDEEKLGIVLAHERSHVRQGDFYLQLAAGLYACVFWFSPLGWWLKHKLCELGEAISDRAGLEKATSRTSYAQLLLEFAALPRPTLTGVAMARTNHLSQRIERLLDESNFSRAFAAAGRRTWLAAVIVPLVLFAATTLVNVQAATSARQAAALSATRGQSTPEQVTGQEPASAPAPASAPETQAAPAAEAAPAPPPGVPAPEVAPEPPAPPTFAVEPDPADPMPSGPNFGSAIPGRLEADTERLAESAEMAADMMVAKAQHYAYVAYDPIRNGDPYALVDSEGKIAGPRNDVFENGGNRESIEKARGMAHGAFLWFEHEGKAYIVDDPAIVEQIQAMQKPMDEIHTQMKALGQQMKDLGAQQREAGRKMREISVPTPDLSKEIADLNAATANLKAKEGGTISQKELGDMQREIGRIQGQLGQLQGKIGAQQGEFGAQMGKFGSEMGALGGQMGQLGAKMGEIARENQSKMKGIITDSLSNGKAKPVQ